MKKKIAIVAASIIGGGTLTEELSKEEKSKGSILDADDTAPRGLNIVRERGIGSLELSEPCLSGRAKRRERRKQNRSKK